MGHRESDEPDHARDRDRRGREQRRGEIDATLYGRDVGAEVTGRFFAECEQVERPRSGVEDGEGNRRVESDDQHGVPRRARQAAPQPEKRVAQLDGIRERDDRGRDRRREGAHGHAAEEQNPGIQRGAADQAQPIDQRQRGEGPDEGGDR